MTKKDFQLIAEVFNRHVNRNWGRDPVVEAVLLDMALELKNLNPRFNIQRFVDAATKKKND